MKFCIILYNDKANNNHSHTYSWTTGNGTLSSPFGGSAVYYQCSALKLCYVYITYKYTGSNSSYTPGNTDTIVSNVPKAAANITLPATLFLGSPYDYRLAARSSVIPSQAMVYTDGTIRNYYSGAILGVNQDNRIIGMYPTV